MLLEAQNTHYKCVYHTEQRVLICCTFPRSVRSCLMRHFSCGSLARGSGGSNSPVKSNQLSSTSQRQGER